MNTVTIYEAALSVWEEWRFFLLKYRIILAKEDKKLYKSSEKNALNILTGNTRCVTIIAVYN